MNKKINFYRLPLQIAILVILLFTLFVTFFNPTSGTDVEAYCPFGGLQASLGYMVTNSLACSMTTRQISLGGMLIVGVILAGKLFCSHLCPLGTLSEWAGKIGKVKRIHWTPPFWLDKGLRIIKYTLLFATLYFTISAGELFCKKYDPYFASMNSGSGDILWITATISLFFAFILPIFITNFWCKYVCPLGAISNIFKQLPVWLPAIILITALSYFGIFSISWVVTLGFIIFSACLVEVVKTRSYTFAGLHIVRDTTSCIDCNKCDKKCPMNIKVSEATIVNHIDCHLCGECITHCPEKNTLSLNKKKLQWAPPLFVTGLIAAGLIISAFTEIPTINQQWARPDQMQHAVSFSQENISAIKCFGSSSSFAARMREINGVVGVACFAGKHSALIYFDPRITKARSIKEAIFETSDKLIAFPKDLNEKVDVIKVGIDHFFDPGDAERLTERFADNKGIYSFSTSFGEPILTTIYFNHNQISINSLLSMINARNYSFKLTKNSAKQKTNFQTNADFKKEEVVADQMIDQFYPSMDIALNDKELQKKDQIKTLTLNFQQSIAGDNFNRIPHLMSHVSGDKGVVNFKATCQQGKPLLVIEYVASKTNINSIVKMLNQPKLNVYFEDGNTINFENPFIFKPIDIN